MASEFKLPELGENIESGTVTSLMVSEGDSISKDQVLLELETDKAVIELPAESDGTIKKLLISEGDEVKVGQPLFEFEAGDGNGADEEKKPAEEEPKEEPSEEPSEAEPAEEKKEEAEPEGKTVPRELEKPEETIKPEPQKEIQAEKQIPHEAPKAPRDIAPAAPSVRRFAREIGIDIDEVSGTGPGGRISIEDVKHYSKVLNKQRTAQRSVFKGFDAEPLPDFSKWGEVEIKSMTNVRQKTASHLSYAWPTIPQVTQFDKADITDLEQLRKHYGKKVEAAGGKLTMTAILIKVIQAALQRFPQFNCSIDMQNKEIFYKKYYNIGIAVDTDRGLLVPVLKDVDKKNITEIAVELGELAEKARNKKLNLEEMQGGNFSISNLGGIGGTAFTPIINAPEVAILGVSRGQIEPVYEDGEFKPRLMLPLSLTYDHRIIDGADAIRFLRWVVEALEQPFLLSLEG